MADRLWHIVGAKEHTPYAIGYTPIGATCERFERLEHFEQFLYYRQAAQARSSQPKRKATPPMGVMAPSQRIPVKLRM
jgi:hypothetical protein